MNLSNILSGLQSLTPHDAYEAGKDYARNGADSANCNFRLFSSREMTKEWERGASDGKKELESEPTP